VAGTQSVHKQRNCSGVGGPAAAAAPAAATVEGSLDPASPEMAEEANLAIVPPALHPAPAPVHTVWGTPSVIVAETVVTDVHALAAALDAVLAAVMAVAAATVAAAALVAAVAVAALAAVATTVDPSMLSAAVETIVRVQPQPCASASRSTSAPSLMIPTDLCRKAQAFQTEGTATVSSSAGFVV